MGHYYLPLVLLPPRARRTACLAELTTMTHQSGSIWSEAALETAHPEAGSIVAEDDALYGDGIEPDLVVEQASIETASVGPQRREADLRGALENEGASDDPNAEKSNGRSDAAGEDYQLSRALDLLHGLSIYNTRPKTN